MTSTGMGVTVVISEWPCGQPKMIHSRPDLSTPGIHPLYTEQSWASPATTGFVHMIHRPYYNDET
jgi:hypothetical protein